jgi:hypothetical protein
MRIKLKFMLPNIETAYLARKEVLAASIDDKYIHFLANTKVDLSDLNVASAFESTNSIHEAERGILHGAAFGFFAGLYVLKFPIWMTDSSIWYTNSPWYVILAVTTVFGSVMVAIGAALLGVNLFNTDLKQYKNRIEKGEILMIVAVPIYSVKKIRSLMNGLCQNIKFNAV